MMITTYVLDTASGQPAERIPVELDVFISGHGWRDAGRGVTNMDGRILDFGETPAEGIYRLMFDVGVYIPDAFFPTISITFEVKDRNKTYHIPLLLSPFGYTAYLGS
ncbi:MAG TPA: hydroxyisourate hydrolase [Bryobacteraceae bacterium]|nr:hydroxyisourate hydrolase [Bryobacteraceae bacterium]